MNQTFQKISALLASHDSEWRFQPFHLSDCSDFPWDLKYPNLTPWLNTLSEAEIIKLKADTPRLVQEISAFIPDVVHLDKLSRLNRLPASQLTQLPKGAEVGIPGRKLNQIRLMSDACLKGNCGEEWLEWCSGKGFLGQLLTSSSKAPVISFEWQKALCDSGQALADKKGLVMRFVQGDALEKSASRIMKPTQHAVALHACGDLHVNLIKRGCEVGLGELSISPCCYHLIQSDRYLPLSSEGIERDLHLTKMELRIPLQATVTGGERVHRHRFEEMSFRLGLDSFLKAQKGHNAYTAIPSIKKSMLSDGFEAFCLWAAKKKNLELGAIDFKFWNKRGEERFWQMERLSLIQQVFQRPLELWLVLDRALYLEENGYSVDVSEFCSEEDTPRNILIQAKKDPRKRVLSLKSR
ncbi:methyltransferase [Vibrio sp. S9_S30]|uniref:methyltransferase n=1 Tax=Vibrio sp. S9_S30 TaxID=2720226 RepID=UPI0016805F10|nr:methyltransferase [Vibrio sp. S9_S30]MBD1557925.1 methyltransferase [Vibrio sp. S9_S30]